MSTNTLSQLLSREQPNGFHNRLLRMDPLRLERVEPGTFSGQKEGQNAHTFALLLDLLVMLANPGTHHIVDYLSCVCTSLLPNQHNGLLYVLITNGFSFIELLIPISLGLAMFRYRLWDIGILINRTLVYGSLTALLALLYFSLIFTFQFLLRGIINQNNDVAIVVSTLAMFAIFQPVRHRIQALIDRRFYRRKYDAAKTLAAFSATLRSEVDLGQLREHLLNVVQETMQPAHVSLWLRSPQRHTEELRHLEKSNFMEEEG